MPPFRPWQMVPLPAPPRRVEILPGALDGLHQVLLLDRALADVIEAAVVALAHHRVDALHRHPVLPAAAHHVLDQRVLHQAHIEGIGQGDGGLQRAQLLNLDKARRLAKAVPDIACGQQLVGEDVLPAGHHHRDAGVVVFAVDGAVSHRDAGDVGDFVALSAGQFTDDNPRVADSFLLCQAQSFPSVVISPCICQAFYPFAAPARVLLEDSSWFVCCRARRITVVLVSE